jgi:kynurenine formamidase
MIFTFALAGNSYRFDTSAPIDISIALDFHGEQPNAFHLPAATAWTVEGGEFIGDTRRGGSCNCETVTLSPHGNGTHSECVGHITNARLAVASLMRDPLVPATLVTVRLDREEGMGEWDRAITRDGLQEALDAVGGGGEFRRGLIVRTLPNDAAKRNAHYSGGNPPYISAAAMRLIRELGVDHLLIDLPSADREDNGTLAAHRIFWDLAATGNDDPGAGSHRTITEMVYVEDGVGDGIYMLNLQLPSLVLDAVPSRPMLFAVTMG